MTAWSRGAAVLVLLVGFGCSSNGTNDAATDGPGTDSGGTDASGGLPGFGAACAPIAQQGDPQCADGLVCISAGVEQGRSLCTKTCTTEDAPCSGGPAGTTPTCGREFQVFPGVSRVCEFFCDAPATTCPPGTTCLVNTAGTMTCQPPIQ
jgi:hypothetical protein